MKMLTLNDAGFTSVSRQVLTSDTADLDQPASAVTLVSPAPGQYADTTATITVTTNPDSPNMPQPTARESDLGDALETQNVGITTENKYDIARSCLELEDAGIPNTDTSMDSGDQSFNNCKTLPIFISGYDVREATQHDLDTLAWYPKWVQLNRDVPGKPSSWKDNMPPCNQNPDPTTLNCDEYPFISTTQGGPATGDKPQADLRLINKDQNQLQGRMLGFFYSPWNYPSLGLRGCGLVTGQEFLAIPVEPALQDVNTTWACNGANPGP